MGKKVWQKCGICNGTGYHFLEHDGVCRYCKGAGGKFIEIEEEGKKYGER